MLQHEVLPFLGRFYVRLVLSTCPEVCRAERSAPLIEPLRDLRLLLVYGASQRPLTSVCALPPHSMNLVAPEPSAAVMVYVADPPGL